MDIVKTRKQIVEFLQSRGWQPRDADGSDFQHQDASIRFKVGTKYGEVTITAWEGQGQIRAIRVISDYHIPQAMSDLSSLMGSRV